MTKKDIVIDTNVLLYYFKDNTKYYKVSVSILENENLNLFITTKNISELFAVLTKQKISWANILLFFNDIQKNCTILYPDKRSLNLFKNICTKYEPQGNKIFDMEIVSIMLSNGINTIATFNHKDFKEISELQIFNECL